MEIFSIEIKEDKDILAARDRARVICEELGFAVTQQLQVTTSVFELGKNILEHADGGKIIFSILTEGDHFALQVEGRDMGPGLTEEQIEELLHSGMTSSTANRGIPAMKRLMDTIELESEPGQGTTIRLVKKKPASTKTFAGNIVNFFQQKFSARENLTLSQELRLQNANLVQSLSLFEEKNEELEQSNKQLLELKRQLEDSNRELQERTAELQEALLSLGDRTTELEAQNRRFTAVLEQMSEGVVITDRSGVVTTANSHFCSIFSVKEEDVLGNSKKEWYTFLGRFFTQNGDDWNKIVVSMDTDLKKIFTLHFKINEDNQSRVSGRIFPILDGDEKIIGRLWIFEYNLESEKV